MRCKSAAYTALAAAVALGCGAAAAQDEFEVEDRIEATDEQTDQRRQDAAPAEDQDLAQRREEIIRSADQALEDLRRQDPSAAELMDQAYGHAVFDTTKGGLILTGAGGTGVARPSDDGEITFMRLGAAGIGLGAGFENYKLVLLFRDEQTYRDFVSGQWDGNLAAQASAGSEGVGVTEQFLGGIRAFHVTDGGLMAQVDVTGTRFWPADRLNEAATIADLRQAAARAAPESDVEALAEADAVAEAEAVAESEAAARDETVAEAGAADTVAPDSPDSEAVADTGQARPERFDELTAERDDLNTFVEAIKAAGLDDSLTGDTPYTVFAPTDEAFESMSGMQREELLAPENREELIRLLRAHIVADDMDQEMARNIPEALTVDGGSVDLDTEGERLMVGDATVIEPDIRRGNLRVYVVDGVLSERPESQVAAADVADLEDAEAELEAEAEELEAEAEAELGEEPEPESAEDQIAAGEDEGTVP